MRKTVSIVLLLAGLGTAGIAWADCTDSPLRCIYTNDKGEVHTDTTKIGQCADSWGNCSVNNCGGDTCGGMYAACARTYNVPAEKVREANANGKDCRR